MRWSQQDLADKAIVSINAVTRLERDEVDPRMSTVSSVEKALVNWKVFTSTRSDILDIIRAGYDLREVTLASPIQAPRENQISQ